jgi:hypothetical protein
LTFQRYDLALNSSICSHPQVTQDTQDTRILFSYFIYFEFYLS